MSKAVFAVDLGGTNLRLAVVDPEGQILAHARSATPGDCDPSILLKTMAALADECRSAIGAETEIKAIGVGAPANVGPQHGVLHRLPNLRQLEGMDLRSDLSARFKMPVTLENDATAAAIGENWLGASREVSDSIMVTLGTGVGGGVILNNEAVRG